MWTAEDHTFCDRKIAEHGEIPIEPLSAFKRRERKPRPMFSHPLDGEIKRLWPMRIPMRELCARIGMNSSAVWKRARRLNLPLRWDSRTKRCD